MNTPNVTRPKAMALRWALLFVLLLTVIILPFVLFEEQIEKLSVQSLEASVGTPQLAVIIGATLAFDVILPVPSSLMNAAAGAALGFALGTVVCWVGMSLGCLFGYWIGATGGTGLVRWFMGEQELQRVERLAGRLGGPTLVLMRAVPVLAEASAIGAGAARYPLGRFVAITSVANLGIAAAYAGVGAFAWSANSFLLAVAGAVGIPLVAYAALRAAGRWGGVPVAATLPSTTSDPAETDAAFSVGYRYPVAFTRGVFQAGNPLLVDTLTSQADGVAKCLLVVDENVARARPNLTRAISGYFETHSRSIQLVSEPVLVPGGEQIKAGFDHIPELYRRLMDAGMDRHAFVLAVGGGALLDAVGFAAATAHRGIRHIRIPTTVLSQNDSGVGVKNAVNFDGVKNYVGTFAPPSGVLIDFDFLEGLNRRDRLAGISEAVKVALIRDKSFFEWLERNIDGLIAFDPKAEEYMIRKSAELHLRQIVTGGDPFENGSARPLDFGHWAAHRLESMSNHTLRHGEAVSVGIALDTQYSVLIGLLDPPSGQRVLDVLDRLSLPLWHSGLTDRDGNGEPAILAGLREFQEHLGGELTVTLLQSIGVGVEVHEIDLGTMKTAIELLGARQKSA